jgi:hypothetical protein
MKRAATDIGMVRRRRPIGWAAAALLLSTASTAPAMTTQELAEALRKAGLPQATMVGTLPGEVVEQTPDFLDGGTYLKVTLNDPHHPHILSFVRQGDRIVAIPAGPDGWKRAGRELQVSIRNADSALRYVQWLLDVTGGGAFWRVSSVADVPFQPAAADEKELQQRIAAARKDLEGKIQPPHAEESGAAFVVHQDAVAGRDLMRYTVRVSKLGLPTVEQTTVGRDLPVVYARGD